jgi:hypothetical protein
MRKLLLATCLCLPMTAQAAVLHYEAGLDPLAPDPRFGFNLTVSDSLFVTNPVDVAGSTHCDPLNGCQYDGSWNLFIFDPVLRSQYLIASLDLALLDHHVVSGTVHSDNGLGDQFDVSLRNGTWHTDWVTAIKGLRSRMAEYGLPCRRWARYQSPRHYQLLPLPYWRFMALLNGAIFNPCPYNH